MLLPTLALIAVVSGIIAGIRTGRRELVILGGLIAAVLYVAHRLRTTKWEPAKEDGEPSWVKDALQGVYARGQVPPPPRKSPGIHSIEVHFAVPVTMSAEQHRTLSVLVEGIARANVPPGKVHWLSSTGDKPMLSQSDAAFLGKVPDPNAPLDGEPSWDPSVLYYETACRHGTGDSAAGGA